MRLLYPVWHALFRAAFALLRFFCYAVPAHHDSAEGRRVGKDLLAVLSNTNLEDKLFTVMFLTRAK